MKLKHKIIVSSATAEQFDDWLKENGFNEVDRYYGLENPNDYYSDIVFLNTGETDPKEDYWFDATRFIFTKEPDLPRFYKIFIKEGVPFNHKRFNDKTQVKFLSIAY